MINIFGKTIALIALFIALAAVALVGQPAYAQEETTPAGPVYTCDSLDVTANDSRVAKITRLATTASQGANLRNITLNWGDGSPVVTTTNAVGRTHKYNEAKTYTVTATVRFMVEGEDGLREAVCRQTVAVPTQPVTDTPAPTPPSPAPSPVTAPAPAAPAKPAPVTPTPKPAAAAATPTKGADDLATTGPADTAAWGIAAILIGAFIHNRLLVRRLNTEN